MNTEHQAALHAELEKITKDLEAIAKLNPETGDWVAIPEAETLRSADENEEADGVEEWNERRALMAQLETRYRNVTRAVEKITAGTYGICEVCSQPIEDDRLNANPAARTCKEHLENESELPQ